MASDAPAPLPPAPEIGPAAPESERDAAAAAGEARGPNGSPGAIAWPAPTAPRGGGAGNGPSAAPPTARAP